MRIFDALRRQWGYPVPDRGERLLAEAKRITMSNGQKVITLNRMLTRDECDDVQRAWNRKYVGIMADRGR